MRRVRSTPMTFETVLTMENGHHTVSYSDYRYHELHSMHTLRVIQNRNIQKPETIRTEPILVSITVITPTRTVLYSPYTIYITMELIASRACGMILCFNTDYVSTPRYFQRRNIYIKTQPLSNI
eukprot:716623_1